MKRILLLFMALGMNGIIYAQANKVWIEFTDKNGSPYSISNPSAYLSQRAINRRTKYGIAVQYNDLPPNPNYIDSVVAKGAVLFNRSGWLNAISVQVPDTTTMLPKIRALPFVKTWKYVTAIKPRKGPSKPGTYIKPPKKLSHATDTNNYALAYPQVHQLQVDCLNNMGFRGKGKRIAIIDTRFGEANVLAAFDSVRTRNQILGTWDFVWEVPKVYDDSANDTHGEMVFSCIGAILPGQMMGDAVDAGFYLLRTEDIYSENLIEDDNWASAAEYADSAGADIITTSLGYNTFDDPNCNFTYADMNGHVAVASIAATIASEKGMVVCAAAGNDGNDSWHYIDSPADADSILTVGAVSSSGSYAYFSSTGPTADGRIKPDVAADGYYATVASPTGSTTTSDAGTSFATPLIAGGVASLWQADSNASNFEIMQAIKQSASQYSHPDSLLGYGVPNFCLAHTILDGIAENKPVSQLVKTYPNPFTSSITLSFYSSFKQNITITLTNMLGQELYKNLQPTAAGGNTQVIINNLQKLSKGMYLVTLTDSQGNVFIQKEVK